MDAILIDAVSKSFGTVQAVSDLSIRVPAGRVYGFLGPNGAGKTTTLRMIMNIIQPDSGTIRLLGDLAIDQTRSRIGYMPEERGLYRKMTVAKVLTYFGSIKGLSKSELARRVPAWLDRVELADRANKKVEELSRGMHQKLQFAVTAINDPEILILDEPFSGLDPINTDLLKSIICEMRGEGRTVIFSTHAMHEAERLCDSILLINKGRVVLDETMAAIKRRHQANVVCIEFEGQDAASSADHREFISRLDMVTSVKTADDGLEVMLTEPGRSQELLRAILDRGRISRFEIKTLSLHEIFVGIVGRSNEENP